MRNPFDIELRGALQPSVRDQPNARALFLRDVGRIGASASTREAEGEQGRHAAWDRAQVANRQGFGARPQRYKAGHPTDYMLRAILRDNAIAEYDRRVKVAKMFTPQELGEWPSATF